MVFAGRDDAGRRLAARLEHLRGEPVVVLGLPRGGIPVAFQVAQALGAPLEVIVVRKLERPSPVQAGIAIAGTVDPSRRSEEVEPTAGGRLAGRLYERARGRQGDRGVRPWQRQQAGIAPVTGMSPAS